MFSLHFSIATLFPFLLFNLKVLNPAGSLVRDCSEHDEIFRCEMKFGKKMNMSDDLLISFLSYDEGSFGFPAVVEGAQFKFVDR